MSRHLVLIRATFPCGLNALNCALPHHLVYAISVSNNPSVALENLQNYCPLPLELVHSIESGSRTDYLERTLHIKYRAFQLRKNSFWFTLPTNEVEFIKTLNEHNFANVAGFLNKQMAPAPPPVIAIEKLPDFIAENLELCEQLLK